MRSDFVKRELVGFEKLDEMRPGDAENVGRSLSRQFLSLRNERNDIALLQRGSDPDQQFVDRPGKLQPIATLIDQRWRLGFATK